MTLYVKWHDAGREPQCAPNPDYPDGIDVRIARSQGEKTCRTSLPYPAKRCGHYLIACTVCGLRVAVTTAGRPDDPRSVEVPCEPPGRDKTN